MIQELLDSLNDKYPEEKRGISLLNVLDKKYPQEKKDASLLNSLNVKYPAIPQKQPSIPRQLAAGAKESVLGIPEGITSLATGVTGWAGGKVAGLAKLIFDTWKSGGREASWQDAQDTANKVAEKISTVGGLYRPQTQMGGETIPSVAAAPFTAAGYGIKKGAEAITKDPEKQAAIEFIGELVTAALLPKLGHGMYKYIDSRITGGKLTVGDLKKAAAVTKDAPSEVKTILKDVPDELPVPVTPKPTPEVPGGKALGEIKTTKELLTPPIPAEPPAPTTPSGKPIPPPVQELIQAIKEFKPLRAEQEAIYTKERGIRMARGQEIREQLGGGEAAFLAERAAHAGEMPKVAYEPIRNRFTQEGVDALFREVVNDPTLDQWQMMQAREGLYNMFAETGGKLPQPRQLELLSQVFGPEFTKAVMSQWPKWKRIKSYIYEAANIPRSIMASFDLSAPLRQGLFMIGRKQFYSSFAKMFEMFASDKAYKETMLNISKHPDFPLLREAKLPITEMGALLGKREERFMSFWAEKIPLAGPIIKASGRAYTGFLNKLRADVFYDLVGKARKLGLEPDKNMRLTKDIANFVGTGTGRGSMWGFERAATTLNTFFFSPRLMASRLNLLNPVYYVKLNPFVRKEALKSLFTVTGVGMTVLALAKMNGWEVGNNPFNPDLGKMQKGNTRLDIWGGFQQYVRTAMQLMGRKTVSATTGKTRKIGEGFPPLTYMEILGRAIESKESPVMSFATTLLKGRSPFGEKLSIPKEVANRFTPMVIQDLYDIWKDDPSIFPYGLAGIFGVGVQTYKSKPKGLRR